MLLGPLTGLFLIVLNNKTRGFTRSSRVDTFLALLLTTAMFIGIYNVDGVSPSWYWPLLMAFGVAILAEALHGEYIDKNLERGSIGLHSNMQLLGYAILGVVVQFIIVFVLFITIDIPLSS